MAKRRYDHKNEEKNTAIRERASAFKEKEKVGKLILSFTPISAQTAKKYVRGVPTGYYGYVSANG